MTRDSIPTMDENPSQYLPHSASTSGSVETSNGDIGALTFDALDPLAIQRSVQSDQAGAIAMFIGTTRDSFKGRKVIKLEYEAYAKLALKTFAEILNNSKLANGRDDHHSPPMASIIRCAIHHRLGNVPVGEISIVIAVSSPHRQEAFKTCEWILEEVKLKAQVWKREWYEDSDSLPVATWKANFS